MAVANLPISQALIDADAANVARAIGTGIAVLRDGQKIPVPALGISPFRYAYGEIGEPVELVRERLFWSTIDPAFRDVFGAPR